jgi:hypothetical protein
MAFVWTPITAGSTKMVPVHVNEIADAADSLANDLGIPTYPWVELDVSTNDFITKAQIEELRDALDYIDATNVCTADNTTFNTTAQTTKYSTRYGTNNATVRTTADATFNSGRNTTAYTTLNTTADSGARTTVDTSRKSTRYNTVNAPVNSTNNGSV